MERRFRIRLDELLEDARVPPSLLRDALPRLETFLQPFVANLATPGQQTNARHYVQGLLSDLGGKDVESIAYLHDRDRQGLQRFIGQASWDHQPLVAELARQVAVELGEPDGVLVFDPSAFPKKGTESVGVARQWCGRLGKVDNCQVGVYLAYASRQEHALIDFRLYLPKEWTQRRRRCREAGVPDSVRFRTRHELILDMLDQQAAVLPHAWISGDDELGRCSWFRQELQARHESYLLAVPSTTLVRDLTAPAPAATGSGRPRKTPFARVEQWCAAVAESAWQTIEVRDGAKGPLVVQGVRVLVQARTEGRVSEVVEQLVVFRERQADGTWKHDYLLSNGAVSTSLAEFARVFKAQHRIEECLQRAKSEAGLADYQVRTWEGWHHHQTLSLLATWFLTQETRRGKNPDPGFDRAGSADALGRLAEWAPRPSSARTDPAHGEPPFASQRTGEALSLASAQPLAPAAV
jgi:SRSO17 transposase